MYMNLTSDIRKDGFVLFILRAYNYSHKSKSSISTSTVFLQSDATATTFYAVH